jgi:hypothetical protein
VGLPTVGPFSLQTRAYSDRRHPVRSGLRRDAFSGPKRKLPWIEHDGRKIGDSGFIIEYLEQRFGCKPNAHLSAAERAIALSMRRLLEENLYWTAVFDRWVVDENWPLTRQAVLGMIPLPLRVLIAPIARRAVRRQLVGHGIAHTADEIHAIGTKDIGAVVDQLRQAVSVERPPPRSTRSPRPAGEHHAGAGQESDLTRAAPHERRRLRRADSARYFA